MVSEITHGHNELDAILPELSPSERKELDSASDKQRAIALARYFEQQSRRLEDARKDATNEIARIQSWLQSVEEKYQKQLDWLSSQIIQYHRFLYDADEKVKTLDLIYVKSSARKMEDSPELVDEELAVDYILSDEELKKAFIKYKPKLLWAELKKVLQLLDGKAVLPDTGEVIPGVGIKLTHVDFKIKLSGE